jgi:hypothetical protein
MTIIIGSTVSCILSLTVAAVVAAVAAIAGAGVVAA